MKQKYLVSARLKAFVRVLLPLILLYAGHANATDYFVTNGNNAGAGSLRQAILDANANAAGAPHTITFTYSGVVTVSASLPTITRRVTIDGVDRTTRILSAPGGNNTVALFVLGAGSGGSTIRNFTLRNTGVNGVHLTVALTGVTLENLTISQSGVHYLNRGVMTNAAQTNLTIRNVKVTGLEDKQIAIHFADKVTNLLMEGVEVSGGGGVSGRAVHFQGIVTGAIIRNSLFNMDDPASADDGDYGLFFAANHSGVEIDNTTFNNCEVHAIYAAAASSNFTVRSSTFNNLVGSGSAVHVKLLGNTNIVSFDNNTFNADQQNVSDDADYAILFPAVSNQRVTLTNNKFFDYDVQAVRMGDNHSNNHDNILIQGNEFARNGTLAGDQGALVIWTRNTTSDGGPVLITENIFRNNTGIAIGLYPANGITYVVPNFTISKNTIYGNTGTQGAIDIRWIDKIVITQNSIYNNRGLGIDLSGEANCGYEGVNRPQLISSTETAAGVYNVVVKMPTLCGTNACSLELFANNAGTTGASAQHYVNTYTGLGSGNRTLTGVSAATITALNQAPYGFWAATLRVNNNCGTSEISNRIGIKPTGPAGVSAGVQLWLKSDDFNAGNLVANTGWEDASGNNRNFSTLVSDPAAVKSGLNFNNYVNFDGDDYLYSPVYGYASGFSAGEVITVLRAATNNVNRGYPYDFGGTPRGIHYSWNDQAIYTSFGTNDRLGYIPSNKVVKDAKAATTITGGNINILSWNIMGNYAGAGSWGLDFNGGQQSAISTANTANFTLPGNREFIAYDGSSKLAFAGDIAETVLYSRRLSETERRQINTYLAIRSGITLFHDYLAANGITTIWSQTGNAGYNNGIAGLYRDDLGIIHQRQAKTISMNDSLTVVMGNKIFSANDDNETDIANDRAAMVWGNNKLGTAYSVTVTGTNVTARLARVWKVQKTNWSDAQVITLKFVGATDKNYLIISNNAGFTAITHEVKMNKDGSVTIPSSYLADGAFFTFARQQFYPGGVAAGLATWMKAGDDYTLSGTTVTSVIDQAPAQRTWTRMYNRTLNWFNTGYNYNAYIQFPNNEHLNTPAFTTAFTNGEVFSVQASALVRDGSAVTTWSFPFQLGGVSTSTAPPSYRNTGNAVWPTFGSSARLTFSAAPKDLAIPTILNLASGGNRWSANIDGRSIVNNAANTTNFTGPSYIGAGGAAFFTGTIPEVIMYNRKLDATEKLKVGSYLAVKYGVTLEQSTSALDYIASDGTVIWASSANAAYKANITAIGRDDLSALYQKQSRSANATTASYFTIAAGQAVMPSNDENTDDIINDKSFFFWSDNNLAVTYNLAVTGEKATMRMPRVWKARKSNWADMPLTLKMHYPASNVYLLISSDPTFATINEEIPVNADGTVNFESDAIPDGAYFTFAKEIKGPGFVNTGVQFWLRADDGVSSGSSWNDFSGNDNNAVQPTVASQPVFNASNTNFNPGYVLDGANDFMNFPTNAGISGTNQFTVVSVSKRNPATTSDIILGAPTDATNGFAYGYTVNKFFVTATTTGLVTSTANYTTANVPMLHAATRAAGNVFSLYTNGAADGGGTAAWTLLSNNLRLGWRGGTTTDQYAGSINEVVVYNRVLTATELQQVNSYLSLKHGLTLANGTQDYIATDGTTRMWTVSKNTGYVQGIAGLGRDEATGLNQKQSVSAVDNTVTMALGASVFPTNAENPNEMDDLSFFTWSSNGSPALFMIPVTSTPNATTRMARVWKVDRTNWTDQDITIKFAQNGDRYLLVNTSDDPMFGATGTTEYALNTATGSITINTADLPDGAYFTVASKLTGPACVNGNISAWLRADYGTSTPGNWIDFSGLQRHGMQGTAAAIPAVIESSVNFNPVFRFNGTSQFLNITPNVLNPGNNNYSIIAVTKPNNINERQVSYLGAIPAYQGVLLQYNNNAGAGGLANIEASWPNNGFWGGATAVNKTDLLLTTYDKTIGRRLRQDGSQVAANADVTSFNYVQSLGTIGNLNNGFFYSGDIAEFIVYNNKALTGTELQRVESYLSLKYGITMGAGAVNYLGSDGTTIMWDAADNAGYNFHITGIGRDDCTELYQKQSINSNGGILALGVGEISTSNVLNTNTIENNNSYLFIADNNLPADYTETLSGLNNLTSRMARIWKVDKTNFADRDVNFKLTGGNEKIYLVVSATDNVFDGTDAAYQLDADGNVSVLTADLPDGAYFTFAKELRGPGYVNVGINLWLRADDNVSAVDNWIDYSGNDNNAIQPTAANQPAFNNATTNYNPGFVFNGTNSQMTMTLAKFPLGTSPRTLISVGTPTNVTGTRYMFGFGNNTASAYNSLVNVANAITYSGFTNDVSGAAGTAVINVPQEVMGTWVGGTNGLASLYSKSRLLLSQNKTWNTGTTGGAYVGMLSNSTQFWQGPLNEVITYNRELAAFERQRISSYLAMKYGYTMDQTTATSYVATDYDGTSGTTYWDATANATYKNNIAGIGRDDKTGLNQKQSRSVNTAANGNMIAIGLNTIATTNLDNSSSFADDLSFLVWGDDGLTGTKTTEYPTVLDPGSCSKITRLQREWKVQKTGSVDVVQMQMFLAGLVPTSTSLSDLKLLVNNSSDFTAASTSVIVPTSYDAVTQTATFSNLSLADGQYFTLVTDLTNEAPGGVKDPLFTWYRADKGVTTATGVSAWADQSINTKDVTQATAAAQPVYNTTNKLFNFNPSITFNGTSTVLTNATISHSAAAAGEEVFTVLIPRDGDFLGLGRTTTGTEQFSRFYTNASGQLGWVSRVGTNAGSLLTTANNLGKIQLANMHRSASPAGAGVIEYNGASAITGAQNFFPVQNQINIGSRRYNASGSVANDLFFNGELAEVAVFSRELTATERLKVASYFGLKYGLTLSHDYMDPDGTVLWNATANATYNYNITGIGRDDCNGLHQKQSRSVNSAEALITLGNGMGIATTNTDNSNDLGNKSALVLGDDNANRTDWTVTNAPADRKRIARTWKVQETNTVSSVTIQAPASTSANAVKLPLEKAGKMYLLVSNSADFTGTVVEMPMTLNGDVWETSYDFTDGQHFTFATGGDCVDNEAVLTAYNAETTAATDKCYTDGWILFKDPADAGKYIAAIYDPAQLIDRTKITAKVNVNAAFNDLGKGTAQKASRLMRRLLEINCAGCYDAVANPQPAFVVRMFYASAEKTGAENVETNNIEAIKTANGLTDAHSFSWFKAGNMTAAQVVSRLSAEGIGGGGQEWVDGALVTGTMDGTEYVDFDGVNGFSTFGGIWTVNLEQVLPVSWGEVKAAPVNNQYIHVNWTTHSELNNHHFVVERSEAGGTFTLLTTVGGRGTTNATNNYSFDDRNVRSGILYQYRIRQVDIDGRSSFSKIVVAQLAGNGEKGLVIRPNPVVTNTLRYEISVQRGQYIQANVLDAAGRVLAKSAFRANSGWNQFTTGVAALSRGTYLLQLILEDGSIISERFIKK
ncbi:MAG: LamG-like jellyroll fold domain-containing protein [Pseudobacter sp.]|uniref:LamG-like jellyroll fold domain-containing protein n=1 Tax=Pseudobacter sp. TaxID=2045420 RepID=UPI003F81DD24